MIEYEVRPERDRFAPQERIRLNLTLINRGNKAVELPNPEAIGDQPIFLIEGPGPQDRHSISAAELHQKVLRSKQPLPGIRIEPGTDWHGSTGLGEAEGIVSPGAYAISSRLVSHGVNIESQPRPFEVEPLVPAMCALGFGVSPLRSGEGQVALIHRGQSASYLYGATFTEARPGIGETKVNSLVLLQTLSLDAADLGLTFRNGAYFDEIDQWIVWRQVMEIHLLSSRGEHRIARTGRPIASLARPPVKTAGGPVQVLALSEDGTEVTLMLFPPERGRATEMAWTLPLRIPAQQVTATLGPAARTGEGHVAALSTGPEGISVHHVRYQGTRRPDAFNTVLVSGCHPVAGGALAVHGIADGSARIGVFVVSSSGSQTAAFVELTFPLGAGGSVAAVKKLGQLPIEPSAAALLYTEPYVGGALRKAGVLAMPDGKLLKLVYDGLHPLPLRDTPAQPILLTPGQDVIYMLYLRNNGTPYLDRI